MLRETIVAVRIYSHSVDHNRKFSDAPAHNHSPHIEVVSNGCPKNYESDCVQKYGEITSPEGNYE
jgi:hypothetical protein